MKKNVKIHLHHFSVSVINIFLFTHFYITLFQLLKCNEKAISVQVTISSSKEKRKHKVIRFSACITNWGPDFFLQLKVMSKILFKRTHSISNIHLKKYKYHNTNCSDSSAYSSVFISSINSSLMVTTSNGSSCNTIKTISTQQVY